MDKCPNCGYDPEKEPKEEVYETTDWINLTESEQDLREECGEDTNNPMCRLQKSMNEKHEKKMRANNYNNATPLFFAKIAEGPQWEHFPKVVEFFAYRSPNADASQINDIEELDSKFYDDEREPFLKDKRIFRFFPHDADAEELAIFNKEGKPEYYFEMHA